MLNADLRFGTGAATLFPPSIPACICTWQCWSRSDIARQSHYLGSLHAQDPVTKWRGVCCHWSWGGSRLSTCCTRYVKHTLKRTQLTVQYLIDCIQ